MKKIMMATALAAFCGAVMGDAIESANTVGYWQQAMTPQTTLTLISFQWQKADGVTSGKLNEMVVPTYCGTAYNHGADDNVTPNWMLTAPQIQVRSAGSYTTRYYADDMWDEQLCTEANGYDPDGDGIAGIKGWGDEFGVYDKTLTANLGGGAWIKCTGGNCNFVIAGGVDTEDTAIGGDDLSTLTLAGANMPIAFQVNDKTKVTWTLTPGTAYNHGANDDVTSGWTSSAPQVQVRSAGSYTTRYYADDMWDEQLCTEANGYDPDGDGIAGIEGWGDEFGVYDKTLTVPVGGGFWMKHPNTNSQDKHTMYVNVHP